jgi:hypothetical protein
MSRARAPPILLSVRADDHDPTVFAPPGGTGRSEIATYVAGHLLDGRELFQVLADPWIETRCDERLSILDDVARDGLVRAALARGG